MVNICNLLHLPSVLWNGWASGRASGLKLSDEVLLWLSVWSEVQIVCIWSSWCHCHPQTPSCLAWFIFKSILVVPFWYQLNQVVLEKRSLNGCSSSGSGRASFARTCCSLLRSIKWPLVVVIVKRNFHYTDNGCLFLQELQYTLKIFNFFFTSVFILEAIIRIISFGMFRYLLDRYICKPQLSLFCVDLQFCFFSCDECR